VFESRTAHREKPAAKGGFLSERSLRLVQDARLWNQFWNRLAAHRLPDALVGLLAVEAASRLRPRGRPRDERGRFPGLLLVTVHSVAYITTSCSCRKAPA
jgi:hypothetical protein